MRPAVLVLLILLIGSVQLQTGCSPTPAPNLTGTWVWEYNANPSGSGSTMYLLDVSGTVTGTELDRGVGCCAKTDTLAISGSRIGTSFALHVTASGGQTESYLGRVVGRDELLGTYAPGTAGDTVIYYRR
jgi:hypothetical protein